MSGGGLNNFGFVEELYLLGCTVKTISNMTKLPQDKVKHIIYEIEKNRQTLKGQNKTAVPTQGRQKVGEE